MMNKIIISILVLLLVLSGGFGYYSYTLSQQLDSLSGQLTALHQEQAAQIGVVSDELTTFRGETTIGFGTLKDEINETLTQIGTLENNLDGTITRIDTMEGEISDTHTKVTTLESEIGSVTDEISKSVMDTSDVYQKVIQATVRISNGEQTIGSGFFLDAGTHVVTAHHVVENLSNIYVVLPDGRVSQATVSGSSQYSDVAVLTLKDKLPVEPPPLADSTKVIIGEPVAAIGNPFDLTETLTAGIVSQTNRLAEIQSGSQTRWIANLIQFDAAVNFGNSGGPLVNSKGEVIGLVIARVNPNEGDGIYYAVSANKVKKVATSLIAQGFFDYPWLGINITNLTPQMAQARELETTNGVVVVNVEADSPAEVAGIQIGDIIVTIDEMAIRNSSDLVSYLGEYKSPNDTATIELIRDTTKLELSIEIGKQAGS